MTKYEILSEHTADQYIRAFGKTLEEAFENAGLALFDTMTDIKEIKPNTCYTVRVSGEDLEALLYSYIEGLIVAFEITGLLFSRISVAIVENNGYSLIARLEGEEFDQERHPQKVGVKAMTYCRMNIKLGGKKTILEFVVDI